jgi:hypothetical protein
VAGETITVPGLPDGEYDVHFYRAWRGLWVEPVSAASSEGTLTVKAPELRHRGGRAQNLGPDVAFKIVRKGAPRDAVSQRGQEYGSGSAPPGAR